jgi:hypothetical protein
MTIKTITVATLFQKNNWVLLGKLFFKRKEFYLKREIISPIYDYSPSKKLLPKLFLHALPNWEMGKIP